jgi:hypothetical protein
MGSHFFSNYADLKPFSWNNLQGDTNSSYKNPGMTSTYTGTAPSVAGASAGYGAPPSFFPTQGAAPAPAVATPRPVMSPNLGGVRGF